VPAGLVAVQLLVLAQLTAVATLLGPAEAPPGMKFTVVAPGTVLKSVPVIVTTVPPAVGPEEGLMAVTVGGL
jgi:hypothetical protein